MRSQSVDGIQHRPATFVHRSVTPQPHVQPLQPRPLAAKRPFQHAPQTGTGHRNWERFQLPALMTGGIIVGYLVQSLLFGIAALILYGVCSLLFRIPSRATFTLAFMALVTVVVLLIVRPGTPLAGNFATYTFLLLVIGVIALAIEARPPKRRKRLRKPRRG